MGVVLGPPARNLLATWGEIRPASHPRYLPGANAYRVASLPASVAADAGEPVGVLVDVLASWNDGAAAGDLDAAAPRDDELRAAIDRRLRAAGLPGRWRDAPRPRPDDLPQPFVALLGSETPTPVIVRERYAGHVFVTHPRHGELLYTDAALAQQWRGDAYVFDAGVQAPAFWR